MAIPFQPNYANANTPFPLTVWVEDPDGNLVGADNSDVVTVSLSSGSGTLGGTLTATAVNGVVSFPTASSALTISQTGTGDTITASDAPLTSATTQPFDVLGPPAAHEAAAHGRRQRISG